MRAQLVMLSHQEVRTGCRESIDLNGACIEVDIPAGVNATTKLNLLGYGYVNVSTGQRGPLRLSFFLV